MQEYRIPKHITHGADARNAMERGVDAVADLVEATIGPKGRNIVIEQVFEDQAKLTVYPIGCTVSKDGVTVARSVTLPDKVENMGVFLIRQASEQCVKANGDGTTTTMCLARHIFKLGNALVNAGANPVWIKKGIDDAVKEIVGRLETMAISPITAEMAHQVASIAANGESEIADLVMEAFTIATSDGVVEHGDSRKGAESYVDATTGMVLNSGMVNEVFVTNPQRNECVFDNPLVLLHEQRILTLAAILPLLDAIMKMNRSVLILSEAVEMEALQVMVTNRGKLRSCAVRLPFFGDQRKALMEDLAAVLGGKAFTEASGFKTENIRPDMLGTCERVVITRDKCTFINGSAKKEVTDERVAQIKNALATAEHEYEKNQLADRLAKLAGGVAIVRVGAATDAEQKEKKYRVEDAIGAVKAAYSGGVLPGGGAALMIARQTPYALDGSEVAQGKQVVWLACAKPFERILTNGGYDPEAHPVMSDEKGIHSLDAMSGEYVDLIKTGIIDPLRVVRSALQNAGSVAGTMLTAEGTVHAIFEILNVKET